MLLKSPLVKSPARQLFLISFLVLFLELLLIRYVPAQIRYVGYFSNIILLASFVGIGLGTIFWKKIPLPFSLFPILLSAFVFLVGILKYDLVVSPEEVIYFNQGVGSLAKEPVFLLPLIFFGVVLLFLPPSALLGELFTKFPPLSAYTINIAGSLAGILLFSLLSFLGWGSVFWLLVVFLVSFLLVRPPHKTWAILYPSIFLITILLELLVTYFPPLPPSVSELRVHWSPYYKVTLYKYAEIRTLSVNNVEHQIFVDPDSSVDPFYQYPYKLFPQKTFEKVLVIGAGGGNDVAKALKMGAKEIVAVEIDPIIVALGESYHPLKPYSDDRVKIAIDDGRSYLVEGKEKFDLVILALTDSLTLTSAASNLRLESYLFTQEAFADIRSHLDEDGLFVLYNFYRKPWLVDKLGLLLRKTFGRDPYIEVIPTLLGPGAILIGTQSEIALPPSNYSIGEPNLSTPTDDWPFLYLKERGIPSLYLSYLGIILATLGISFPLLIKKAQASFDGGFFFLGAAFMLLETKNVVQFSLLFGSTWLTNAFVFTGLLALVLLAIWVAKKFPNLKLSYLYPSLFALIFLTYLIPQRELLTLSYFPRLITAILINFSPVFFANLIFALLFAKTKIAPLAYGANIFGAFVGGVFEYNSLVWGYKNLLVFVALFYLLSLLSAGRMVKSKTP